MPCDCRQQISAVHLRVWCGATQTKVDCKVDGLTHRHLFVEIEKNRRLNPVRVSFDSSSAAGSIVFGPAQAAQWPETLDASPNMNKGPSSETILPASGCSGPLTETLQTSVAVDDLGGPFGSRPLNVGNGAFATTVKVK